MAKRTQKTFRLISASLKEGWREIRKENPVLSSYRLPENPIEVSKVFDEKAEKEAETYLRSHPYTPHGKVVALDLGVVGYLVRSVREESAPKMICDFKASEFDSEESAKRRAREQALSTGQNISLDLGEDSLIFLVEEELYLNEPINPGNKRVIPQHCFLYIVTVWE